MMILATALFRFFQVQSDHHREQQIEAENSDGSLPRGTEVK